MRELILSPEVFRTQSKYDELVNKIIKEEWDMFDKVSNIGGRANCQDDADTFYVMRYSNFCFCNEETLKRYHYDLLVAFIGGRNLVTEKYAYMMKYSNPEYFSKKLKPFLPQIPEGQIDLVQRVADILMFSERKFSVEYPKFSSAARPLLYDIGPETSFHNYMVSELKTYSFDTLKLYSQDLESIINGGYNPSHVIHEKMAEFYGYANLDEAEESFQKR